MKNPRCCEHTGENAGPCHNCRNPMQPRAVKFVGSRKEWLLLFREKILQRGKTLSDLLTMTKDIEDREERNFMITCPNDVRLSLEVARKLGV